MSVSPMPPCGRGRGRVIFTAFTRSKKPKVMMAWVGTLYSSETSSLVITPLFLTASKSSFDLKMISSVISNGPAFLLRTTLAMSRNGVGTVGMSGDLFVLNGEQRGRAVDPHQVVDVEFASLSQRDLERCEGRGEIARGGDAAGIGRMHQAGACFAADRRRQRLRRRRHLDDDAKLVRRHLHRLEVTHHAVLAVDVGDDLVALLRHLGEIGASGTDHLGEDLVDLGNEDGIARAGDEDAAPARGLGALELYCVRPGGIETAARDTHAPVGDLLVLALR